MRHKIIPSQEKFTSMVERVYKNGSHKIEPVRTYQIFLNSLPNGKREHELIRYIFSNILWEPNHDNFSFICYTKPVYTAWIHSNKYSIEINDIVIRIFDKSGWDVGYHSGNRNNGVKEILVNGLEEVIVKAASERAKKRKEHINIFTSSSDPIRLPGWAYDDHEDLVEIIRRRNELLSV